MEESSTSVDDGVYEKVPTNQQMGAVSISQSVKGETMGQMLAMSDHKDTRFIVHSLYDVNSAIM